MMDSLVRLYSAAKENPNYSDEYGVEEDFRAVKAALAHQSESAEPSAAVPKELLPRIKNLLVSLGHQGVQLNPDEPPYDVGEWGVKEAQELYGLLTAAPQPPKEEE